MSKTKKYWKGIEDLNNDPAFIKGAQNEFAEEIPLENLLDKKAQDENATPRRDFLKFLGFSVTAATLAACETPVTRVIPYVVKPEEVTPGVPNWYASAFFDGQQYCGVVVKTREGRPIKIEGNTLDPLTKGGTSARVQASVLSLYDSARLKGPVKKGGSGVSWKEADAAVIKALEDANASGAGIRILSSTIISPSTKQIISEFTAKYPTTKHVTYDAVSHSGMLQANKASFGKAVIPTYNFDKAKVIVSLNADFLGTWISPIEYANKYIKNRKVTKENPVMSRHYQFESNLSITGATADVRVPAKPSEINLAALSLYKALGGSVDVKALPIDKAIQAAAAELNANKGAALVVSGSNDPNVQLVVNKINEMLGSYGSTIDMDNYSNVRQGMDSDVLDLISEMNSGKVHALIVYNTNPSYSLLGKAGFNEALSKVKFKVALSDRMDETASFADYVLPDHHYLESWGDANPTKGVFALIQPTIYPIHNTRAAQESLLTWMGSDANYQGYLTGFWEKSIFPTSGAASFPEFWTKTLLDGAVLGSAKAPTPAEASAPEAKDKKETKQETAAAVVPTPVAESAAAPMSADIAAAAAAISKTATSAWEISLYEKVGIGDGRHANNPWLQELPDPISKVTWDNYITMNPKDMEDMKLNMMLYAEREASTVDLNINGSTVSVAVYPSPGQARGTVGLALGYGRTNAGKAADGVGVNAYPLVSVQNGGFSYYVSNASLTPGKETYKLAATQTHHTLMGREIVKETTLSQYKKDPKSGNEQLLISVRDEHGHHVGKQPEEVDLWASQKFPGHTKPGHFWGMSVDLNSCIGCGACVVSCQAENNVPVVGKDEVSRSREMHWLRIDRYYSSDADPKGHGHGVKKDYTAMEIPAEYPNVAFQPLMCVHCNHAPCETVCPVVATTHSSEGLNQMTYNRCVGTRYCANNCPYKVRRFNWFKYSDNEMFDYNMNDSLGKMVLNPDVVVRSRGVMEKCTMCVQRIQEGKLIAKKAGRKIADGEIKTACQQACPTNAIIFGDLNDESSVLRKLNADERRYHLLEELNTQPSVFYMTKVNNRNEEHTA